MEQGSTESSAPDPLHRETSKGMGADGPYQSSSNNRSKTSGGARTSRAAGAGAGGGELGAARPNSFAGHYGQLIITEGIAPIPKALYLYQGILNLSPQQVWFISCVLAHKWDGGLPHPSLQEIAAHATLGLRQVKKIKSSIVDAGLLEVTPRYGSEGEQDANSYDFGLLFDKLESLIAADPSVPQDELAEAPLAPQRTEAPILRNSSSRAAAEESEYRYHNAGETMRDYSFAARFGRIILRRGVATLPKALFTYQGQLALSPQQLWFASYILSFQWSIELPYPSLRKMAANTGYSERQIHRIKDTLVGAGYLRVIERRGADGRDTTSAYDFTEMLKSLNRLISKDALDSSRHVARTGGPGEVKPARGRDAAGKENARRALHQTPLERYADPPSIRGELHVSGGVNCVSVEAEPDDSERVTPMSAEGVNPVSVEGVNPVSVEGVNCESYGIESAKEEPGKEELHQQQGAEIDEDREDRNNAYDALVDVGVIPGIALELANGSDPDRIFGWVRYYLSVLSRQENLTNPVGILVSRLRSADEPPYVPSPGDLQSLRLQMSRYR